MAFGTADGGGPQVGGLLRGLPRHLHPQEARAQVGEDEGSPGSHRRCGRGEALLLPSAEAAVAGEGGGAAEPDQRAAGHTAELPAPGGAAAMEWQMVRLKKRVEATEEGMTKVRSHPRQGTGHAAASLLLAHRSCPTECHSRLCPVPHPALRGVLPYAMCCPMQRPAWCGILPYSVLPHTSTLPYTVSWLMPRTALHDVLLWVASCPAQCPAPHSDVTVS